MAYWLPRLVFTRPPSASALLILFGMLSSLLFPGVFSGLDPTDSPALWEVTAEIVVIVVLFATGLRIDDLGGWRLWRPTVGLLAVSVGCVLGRIHFVFPPWNTLAETGLGELALAGVLLCYGFVELAEGYGFIGAFVAGIVVRRAEEKHVLHRRLHTCSARPWRAPGLRPSWCCWAG